MGRHIIPQPPEEQARPLNVTCSYCENTFEITAKFQNACMQEFGYLPCKVCGKHLTKYSIMKGVWY